MWNSNIENIFLDFLIFEGEGKGKGNILFRNVDITTSAIYRRTLNYTALRI
jgi:hypothetical protein